MQTLNFNCSFCNKLMAVGMNLIGRNVRCPHCKQVVQAPATVKPTESAPAPVALQTKSSVTPTFKLPEPQQEGQESIFGEEHDDDLFGGTKPPQVKMPGDLEARIPPPKTVSEMARTEQMLSPAANEFNPKPAAMPILAELQAARQSASEPWSDRRREPVSEPLGIETEDGDEQLRPRMTAKPVVVRGGGGIMTWMLLLYGVVATGVAAFLFYEKTQSETKEQTTPQGSSFLTIPDFFGEYERASRKQAITFKDHLPKPDAPLPADLQVRLNDTLKVGDLEVTPLRVEFRMANRFRKRPGNAPAFFRSSNVYLLHVRLKNTSEDVVFHPTDPAFNRHPGKNPTGAPIYTGVTIGKRAIMGGPFVWPDADHEYLEGQENDDQPLEPGQERDYVIATNFDIRDINKALETDKESPVMWRVQLRRGLVTVKDGAGDNRDISITSVVGVVFDRQEIRY